MTIYLIDSDPMIWSLAQSYLSGTPYHLMGSKDLPERIPSENCIVFCECDLQTPVNWNNLSECFQNWQGKHPWVITSLRSPSFEQSHQLIKLGLPFLHKPFTKDSFLQKINRCSQNTQNQ